MVSATAPASTAGELSRGSPFADAALSARCWGALAIANARYWSTVAPLVRVQLRRWRGEAEEIADPALKALAIEKLRYEHFNAEVAATLATLAPRAYRRQAIEAIVALEILFDYLDGRTETLGDDPLREGRQIMRALADSVDPGADLEARYPLEVAVREGVEATSGEGVNVWGGDGMYVGKLVRAVHRALSQLPAADVVRAAASRAAERCGEAQLRAHLVPRLGAEQVREWASQQAESGPLQWREYLAGASASVLAMHALIAAAADSDMTVCQADALEETYLCIAVMSTTLDSVIDRERDLRTGEPMHVGHYQDAGELARRLADVATHVAGGGDVVPHRAHHVMTLTGVVAYYISSPSARAPFARTVAAHMRRHLSPAILPTLLVMRSWRLLKTADRRLRRLRSDRRRAGHGAGPIR